MARRAELTDEQRLLIESLLQTALEDRAPVRVAAKFPSRFWFDYHDANY